jgi:hypothetical protein
MISKKGSEILLPISYINGAVERGDSGFGAGQN